MKPRLFWTMLLAFALVIVLGVCGMLGFFGLAISGLWQPQEVRSGFQEVQASYAASLGDYYAANNNSWAGVERRLDAPPFGGPGGGFVSYTLADTNGRVVASSDPAQIGKPVQVGPLMHGVPVEAHGARVGTLFFRTEMGLGPRANQPDQPARPRPASIFWPIARGFLSAGLGLVLVLLLLAVIFARRLSRPLRDLTQAAEQLAAGRLDVQVRGAPVRELDNLSRAFNAMASSLALADRQRRQMTADIAHELRTPLSIIKGRLEGMQDGVYGATPDQLEHLLDETALLERLIEDLRLLALAEAGQLPLYTEPLDPRDLLDAAAAAFARQAESHDVALRMEAPDALPQIDADPQRMAQVLANLVANALRYTPTGGTITLSASIDNETTEPPSDGATGRGGGEATMLPTSVASVAQSPRLDVARSVVFRVSDTGQGIAPEDLPYIFDRFYRADRSRARSSGGAGLGLAIARQIVVAHGGTIWAESEPGCGTTIAIALPAARDEQ